MLNKKVTIQLKNFSEKFDRKYKNAFLYYLAASSGCDPCGFI